MTGSHFTPPPFTAPELNVRPDCTAELTGSLGERILIIDGAMGTAIQRDRPDEAGYRGERFKDWPSDVQGNNELLTLTRPDIISGIHREYLEAGADILETNTFSANRVSMAPPALTCARAPAEKAMATISTRPAVRCCPGGGRC